VLDSELSLGPEIPGSNPSSRKTLSFTNNSSISDAIVEYRRPAQGVTFCMGHAGARLAFIGLGYFVGQRSSVFLRT